MIVLPDYGPRSINIEVTQIQMQPATINTSCKSMYIAYKILDSVEQQPSEQHERNLEKTEFKVEAVNQ